MRRYTHATAEGKRVEPSGRRRFILEEITGRRVNSPSEFAATVAGVASGKNSQPEGLEREREKVRSKEERGSEGWRCSLRVGGPCNDLTAVVTFLISARFNYTVDEEGARPPLALASPFSAAWSVPSLPLGAFLVDPSRRPGQSS